MTSPLHVGVIGVGHLGKEHARIYSTLPEVQLVAVCDVVEERARDVAAKCSTTAVTDYRELLNKVDAVSIATPTVSHQAIAADFLKRGIATLVEKPLAKAVEQAEELTRLAHAHKAVLQVGHVERFNPAIVAVKGFIETPRFIECHRLSPFRFRSVDIDVVLDLMIHDIDIILHWVLSSVKKIDAVGVSLLFRNEDIVNARLEFEDGCIANVTASRISDKVMRKMRLFSEHCYASLDMAEKSVQVYRVSPELKTALAGMMKTAGDSATFPSEEDLARLPKDFYSAENMKIPDGEPLAKELEAFVGAARAHSEPVVTGEHGVRAMKVVDAILREVRNHRWV